VKQKENKMDFTLECFKREISKNKVFMKENKHRTQEHQFATLVKKGESVFEDDIWKKTPVQVKYYLIKTWWEERWGEDFRKYPELDSNGEEYDSDYPPSDKLYSD
jgi:hypothetical protein